MFTSTMIYILNILYVEISHGMSEHWPRESI